jgi:hypothetical protein
MKLRITASTELRRAAPVAAMMVALSFAGTARAQTAQQKGVEEHFWAGVRRFDQGQYEAARIEFSKSLEIMPRAATLRSLAVTELKLNRPLEALEHLRAFMAMPSVPADKRELGKQNLDEAYARTGHIAIRTNEGATLAIDGEVTSKRDVDVMPGRHVLEARVGERSERRDVEAPAGVVVRADLELKSPPPASASITSGSLEQPQLAIPETPPPAAPTASASSTKYVVAGAFAAASVGVVVVGLVLDGAARSNRDEATSMALSQTCAVRTSAACSAMQDRLDARKTDRVLAEIAFTGAIALGVGAIVTWMAWPDPAKRGGLLIVPTTGPHHAGIEANVRF